MGTWPALALVVVVETDTDAAIGDSVRKLAAGDVRESVSSWFLPELLRELLSSRRPDPRREAGADAEPADTDTEAGAEAGVDGVGGVAPFSFTLSSASADKIIGDNGSACACVCACAGGECRDTPRSRGRATDARSPPPPRDKNEVRLAVAVARLLCVELGGDSGPLVREDALGGLETDRGPRPGEEGDRGKAAGRASGVCACPCAWLLGVLSLAPLAFAAAVALLTTPTKFEPLAAGTCCCCGVLGESCDLTFAHCEGVRELLVRLCVCDCACVCAGGD